jgi:hypothetical protein
MSCKVKEKQPETEIVEETKEPKGASSGSTRIESLNNRGAVRLSRRSSMDLDHILGLNPDNKAAGRSVICNCLLSVIVFFFTFLFSVSFCYL